jgi:hypothetical protein
MATPAASTNAGIIQAGYDALTGKVKGGSFMASLAADVTLTDHDRNIVKSGQREVADYLQGTILHVIDLTTPPVIKDVGGEVICLDRLTRDGGHCCVDRFEFEGGKVKRIDICWMRPGP